MTLDELCGSIRMLGTFEAFELKFPQPALVVRATTFLTYGRLDRTQWDRPTEEKPPPITVASRVHWLAKTSAQVAGAVLVGRGSTCDVVVDYSTVSTAHAVFVEDDEDGWFLVDHQSLNGTYLNGAKVESGVPWSVSNNDEVFLGRRVVGRFLKPRGLWQLCLAPANRRLGTR